jgi:hypothetical protein
MDKGAPCPLRELSEEGVPRGAITRTRRFDLDQLMVMKSANGFLCDSLRHSGTTQPDHRLELMSQASQMPALLLG